MTCKNKKFDEKEEKYFYLKKFFRIKGSRTGDQKRFSPKILGKNENLDKLPLSDFFQKAKKNTENFCFLFFRLFEAEQSLNTKNKQN